MRGLMTVYRHALVGAFLMVVAAGPARAQQVTNEFFEAKIRPGARGQVLRVPQQQDERAERLSHARQP